MNGATTIGYGVLLALFTGTHAATWGAFKDAPFEGFKRVSFLRTIVVAQTAAMVLVTAKDLELAAPVLVGVLYAAERLATEWWKSFVREDDQSAYSIPMRVAVLGRPVDAPFPRYVAGAAVLAVVVTAAVTTTRLQPADGGPVWKALLIGGVGGWMTAAGGAWKDAPVEGFSAWKFLRSPTVATAWTVLLLLFTRDWVALAVGAAGLSVLSIETYKTFFTGGRPPGKFAGKPVRQAVEPHRDRCRFLHAASCAALASTVGLTALLGPAALPVTTALLLALPVVAAVTTAVLVAPVDTCASTAGERKVGGGAGRGDRQGGASGVEVALRRAGR